MQDEQFDYIDQGWAAMKETLDREMPVERRRKAIWWWFPVGIGALLLLGWAVWRMTPVADTSAPDPVAHTTEPSQTPKTTKSSGPATDGAEQGSGSEEQASVPTQSATTTLRSAGPAPTSYRPVPDVLPFLPSRTSYLSYSSPQPPLLVTDMDFTVRQDPFTVIDPIRSISTLLDTHQPEVPASVLDVNNRTPWQLWVEAGTHHGGTNWLSGGQAGLLFRKPLGKWQFQTGLSLGIRQLSYERGSGLVNLSQSEQDSQTDPDLGLGNPNNAQAPLPTDLSLMGTQLRTQAILQRRFGDHWRVGLGVGASYWTNTRRQWTYSPGSSFQPTQENRDFVNQFSGSSGQRVAETAFRSFGVSVLSGVEYQINPRWAAGLDYHFGLTNHSQVDGFVVYDRFGQVSVRYRIK